MYEATDGIETTETLETSAGVEDQGAAEPEEEGTDNNADEVVIDDNEGEEEQEVASPAQSDEDNARYAAARRKAERERDVAIKSAVEQARAELEAEFNETIAGSQLYDTYSNKPVKTLADFNNWQAAYSKDQLKSRLEEIGIDEEELEQLVSLHPTVRQAQQKQKEYERLEQDVKSREFKGIVDEAIKEIQKDDPSIKSVADLLESENGAEIEKKIQQGYSITDAWKLANLDKIIQRKSGAAKLETAKNLSSKEHLSKSNQHGKTGVTVPPDIVSEYLKFNPKATMEQIQKHYEKDTKQFRKKKG